MVIDPAPNASSMQKPASASNSSYLTESQMPQDGRLAAESSSVQVTPSQGYPVHDEEHPDFAPPPYELVAATPSPGPSSQQVLRRSTEDSAGSSRSAASGSNIGTPDTTHYRSPSTSTEYVETKGVETRDLETRDIHQDMSDMIPSNPTLHLSPSFLRPVPAPSASSTNYERLTRPFVINAKPGTNALPESFATVGTPALYKHDVQEADWEELLQDVRNCARLSGSQRVVSSVLPVTKNWGPPGYLASLVVEQGIKKQKNSNVATLLEVWNERFFRPRRLEITLCRGDKRKSGKDQEFMAPDRIGNGTQLSAPSSSSLSSVLQTWESNRGRGNPLCCKNKQAQADKPYRLVVVSL